MSFGFLRFLKPFSLYIMPFSYCLLLMLFMMVPLPIASISSIKPFLPFIPLYIYAIYLNQDRFSYGFVFLVGFLSDLLFYPLGVMTFVTLLYYLAVSSQIKNFYGKSFTVVFAGFCLFTFIAVLVQWLVISIYHAQFFPFLMPFFSYLCLICLYFPFSLIALKITSVLKKEGGYDPRF